MVNAINLAKIVKLNSPFTTIVNKNKVKHSISIDDIFFKNLMVVAIVWSGIAFVL
jgi:hypothetical protein